MSRGTRLCAATLALLAVAAAPAAAAPADVSATLAYVKANSALVKVAHQHLAAAEAAPGKLKAKVQQECPGVGHQSPQNVMSERLSDEVIGSMVWLAAQPDLAALHKFLHTVTPLHWGSASLNRTMHKYITSMTKLSKLALPNVCADVTSWVSSGFTTLPATTTAFDAVFLPNWVAFGFQPKGLSRYESGSTHALARHAEPLESDLQEAEAREVETWGDILNVLEIGD